MWIQSDPVVNVARLKGQPHYKHCDAKGQSTRYCSKKHMASNALQKEDSVIESLFLWNVNVSFNKRVKLHRCRRLSGSFNFHISLG